MYVCMYVYRYWVNLSTRMWNEEVLYRAYIKPEDPPGPHKVPTLTLTLTLTLTHSFLFYFCLFYLYGGSFLLQYVYIYIYVRNQTIYPVKPL